MSCLCSLAQLPGPLTEPRLSTASAPHSAPAKPALAQRKACGRPGTGTGSAQATLFSSLFHFSVSPGMCLHMVEKMQRAGRSIQERHPPCPRPRRCWAVGPAGTAAHASVHTQGKAEEPLTPVAGEKPRDERNSWGNTFLELKKGKCIICTDSVNAGSQRKRQNLF